MKWLSVSCGYMDAIMQLHAESSMYSHGWFHVSAWHVLFPCTQVTCVMYSHNIMTLTSMPLNGYPDCNSAQTFESAPWNIFHCCMIGLVWLGYTGSYYCTIIKCILIHYHLHITAILNLMSLTINYELKHSTATIFFNQHGMTFLFLKEEY